MKLANIALRVWGVVGLLFGATASPATAQEQDTASADIAVHVVSAIPEADLRVSQNVSHKKVLLDQTLTYTVTLKNFGPSNATNAALADTFPPQMDILSFSASGTKPPSLLGGSILAEWNSLTQNESATLSISAKATTTGYAINTAVAEADETDPNSSNNSASLVTEVAPVRLKRSNHFEANPEDLDYKSGWSKFGINSSGQAVAGWTDLYGGAIGGKIWADAKHFRTTGYMANQTEWLPYNQVGRDNYVRVKYYVWAQGQGTTSPMEIPNIRLRAQTRFAVNSMLEVLHHDNGDPNGSGFSTEFRPSKDSSHPSLYRVDFDPVDVPYLVSNGDYEGIQRAFEIYATNPQDNGYVCVGESMIGTYPAALLDDSRSITTGTKIYAPTASDAGDLKLLYPQTDLSITNLVLQPTNGVFAATTTTVAMGTHSEGSFGVTLDTTQVPPAPVCGVVTREFYPGSDTTKLVRVEEGRQYKVRWHLTSTQKTNRQAQIRLRARACKYAWTQKFEIGGAWATGNSTPNPNNTIAQQVLPGIGCQNPDRAGYEDVLNGGWYTMLVHTPLSRDIRPEATDQPLALSMPKLSSCPGPGDPSTQNSYRDLKVACDLVDTLSQGSFARYEQGNVTIDRIEVRTYDLVDDAGY